MCHDDEERYKNKEETTIETTVYARQPLFVQAENKNKTPKLNDACTRTLAARFRVRQYTDPATAPTHRSCNVSPVLWSCTRANTTVVTASAFNVGMYLVSDGRRNPRKTVSSMMGARTTVVRKIDHAPRGPALNAF